MNVTEMVMVSALRKEVDGHDVSIRSQAREGERGDSARAARDLVKMAAGPGTSR